MAHIVICKYCGEKFDRDKEPFIEVSCRRYSHKACYDKIENAIPQEEKDYEKFRMPMPMPLKKKIKDIFDFENKVDEKYYYTKGKYKEEMYNMLIKEMDDESTVYQWRRKYVRKNQNNLVPTLTANMGEGGHNVPLIKTQYGIRKLTPIECFYAQGYPRDYQLPTDMTDSKLYKQAGNSVVVPVINRIAENIMKALNN